MNFILFSLQVEIFSLQMMRRRNAYTAFGFYNLDCKHICSVSIIIYVKACCKDEMKYNEIII